MKMNHRLIILLLISVILVSCQKNVSRIKKIDVLVAKIDKNIKDKKYNMIQPDMLTHYSSPIKFYYWEDELMQIETADGGIGGFCNDKYYIDSGKLVFYYSECGSLKSDYSEKSDTIHFDSNSCKITLKKVYFSDNSTSFVGESNSETVELFKKEETVIKDELIFLTNLIVDYKKSTAINSTYP